MKPRNIGINAVISASLLLCVLVSLVHCTSSPVDSENDDASGKIILGAPAKASRTFMLKELSDSLRDTIRPDAGLGGMFAIVTAAIAYGILHALGPGHQKTLISGLVLAEGGSAASVAAAAGIAAASHAASVLALFGGLALVRLGTALSAGDTIGDVISKLSGIILVVIAAYSLAKRIRTALRRDGVVASVSHVAEHSHGSCPSCRACAKPAEHRGSTLAMVAAGSLVPCPGAAFFLLYGFSAGNPLAGVLAVLALSLGMWMTLFIVGLLSLSARKAGERHESRIPGSTTTRLYGLFGIVGGVFVLVFAIGLIL